VTAHIDPVIERLVRVEVLTEVNGKQSAEILRRLDAMQDRLEKIDADVNAAKVGGKVAYYLGLFIASAVGFAINHFVPFFSTLPR
jgi:hypothetical protein